MSEVNFDFSPSFQKLEEFMRFYQSLHAQNMYVVLRIPVSESYHKATIGYPDTEQNCWITLRFAVDQMNRAYSHGNSKVRIQMDSGGGN